MSKEIYFFDSYAIIETISGNKNYKKYENSIILTTKLNLFEVYYIFLRNLGEKEASFFLDEYYKFIISFNKKTIEKAAKFKLQNKKRKLSMTDCIGYILSKEWRIKFLTGDKEFENMDNVEFAK